jgi:hypothetical protein
LCRSEGILTCLTIPVIWFLHRANVRGAGADTPRPRGLRHARNYRGQLYTSLRLNCQDVVKSRLMCMQQSHSCAEISGSRARIRILRPCSMKSNHSFDLRPSRPHSGPFQPICSPKRRGSNSSSYLAVPEDSAFSSNCRPPQSTCRRLTRSFPHLNCLAYHTRSAAASLLCPLLGSYHIAVVLLRTSLLVGPLYSSLST